MISVLIVCQIQTDIVSCLTQTNIVNCTCVANHVPTVFFQEHPQQKGVSAALQKNKIKLANHASFAHHCLFAPVLENFYNTAKTLPVESVWETSGKFLPSRV